MTYILGAGYAGMAAGMQTGFPVYEASDKPGGMCRSYRMKGFEFCQGGGHWIFGNNEGVEFIKSLVPVNTYERRAGVYYNTIFPYPIQTVAQKETKWTMGSLKGWLSENFSKAECNLFFYPFNEKYTAGLYDSIVQFDAYKTPPKNSVGFCSQFHDPIGGLSNLTDKMASKCNIKYNKKAVKIDTEDKILFFEDGETVEYEELISTIPLDQLLSMCGESYDLPYTSVLVINIGAVPDVNFPKEHWLYVPFCKSGFYRLGFSSNVNPDKAPVGLVSLSAEIAFKGVEFSDIDVEEATRQVVRELQDWGFIDEVIVTDPTWVRHAYTWMRTTQEREEHIEWLKQNDIITIGRYGKWKFQGMAESIMDGLSV